MEVTVVMALSAISISIIYTAFNIVRSSYLQFDSRNARISELVWTDRILSKDFSDSRIIKRFEDGLVFGADSGEISYIIKDKFILRDQMGIRTDTLAIEVEEWNTGFGNVSSSPGQVIDQLQLSAIVEGTRINLNYTKSYSSADLIEQSILHSSNSEK